MMPTTRAVRLSLFRPAARFTPQLGAARRYASGDYGSGTGDPRGENPQSQGPNPSADKEHPGPPPPSAGQNSGSTPTKGTPDGHNTEQSKQGQSSGTSGKQGTQQAPSSSKNGGSGNGSGNGQPEPKILNPGNGPKPEGESVEAHNKAFEQRAERNGEQASNREQEQGKDQKVGKNFWAGKMTPPPPPSPRRFDAFGWVWAVFVAGPLLGAVVGVAYTIVEWF